MSGAPTAGGGGAAAAEPAPESGPERWRQFCSSLIETGWAEHLLRSSLGKRPGFLEPCWFYVLCFMFKGPASLENRTPPTAICIEWPSWPRRRTSKSGRRSRCAARWRPCFASSVVRREPSAWGLLSGPLKPSSHAGFGLALPNPPLTQRQPRRHVLFRMQALLHAGRDASSRHPCAPLPYRRASQFLAASFARSRFEVLRVWRMRERRAGWGLLQVFLPLTFTENENVVDPRGLPAALFSGTGWVWGIL